MDTLRAVQGRIFDSRFPWHEIDKQRALQAPGVLDLVREACLIESYFAIYTARMMELFWYDVDATSVFSIEAFEAYSHFYILRRYLEIVGYRPIHDDEIAALRAKDRDQFSTDEIRELVNFMMTEHFAAQFFNDLADRAGEPVLQGILRRLSQEEVTHSQLAAELLAKRLAKDPAIKERILHHARHFRHIGAYVLPSVSNAKDDNLGTILSMDRRLEQLTGSHLRDALVSTTSAAP